MSDGDDAHNVRNGRDPAAQPHVAAQPRTATRLEGSSAGAQTQSPTSDPAGPLDVSELCRAAGLYESEDLVRALLSRVPEFAPTVVALVEEHDDDPGEPMVLIELADFIAPRLGAIATERSVVEAAMACVEALLDTRADDEVERELFAAAFFDSFAPEDQHRLAPWLGPRARALLDALDSPPTDRT
jgi:hypothetical protein